jgi:hypothetical protein
MVWHGKKDGAAVHAQRVYRVQECTGNLLCCFF